MDKAENSRRMLNGELYYAFNPDLIAARSRCAHAVHKFNDARDTTRRHSVKLWRA